MLLPDEAGFLEAEGPMEKTHKVTQNQVGWWVLIRRSAPVGHQSLKMALLSNWPQIWEEADIQTASNIFDLSLKEFGPYTVDYTRNGR